MNNYSIKRLALAIAALSFTASTHADQLVYTDSLQNGWQNWSWATVDFNHATTVHSGTKSISVTAGGYQAVSFWHSAQSSGSFSGFSFWIHGGTAGGQTLQVVALTNTVELPAVAIPAPVAGTWQQVTVSLASLGVAGAPNLTRFHIKNSTGNALTTFYVDDVSLTSGLSPVVQSVTPAAGTVSTLTSVVVTFSKSVIGVDAGDLLVNGNPALSVSGSGQTYTFTFAQPPQGVVAMTWVSEHGITDQAVPPNAFDGTGPGGSWQYTLVGPVTYTASTFVHPGALNSKGELDFVKAQIQAGTQPWTAEFNRIMASSYATRTPNGKATINSNTGDAELSRDDAIASYTQALLWYYSGNATYANRAIAILNSWTNLQSFTAGSDQDKLQAGWIGGVFAPAAEIMRGYPGWTTNDIANLQAMFRRAFYPQLNTMSTWNGNVDLTQIDAMMAISVFNEDSTEFSASMNRLAVRIPSYIYLASAGIPPPIAGDGGNVQNFWFNPTLWTNGLTQETCRDNGHHTQFALGSALHAAETAWHQGVDVYTTNAQRFTYALELLASQFLTGSMQGTSSNNTPSADRYESWEVGYTHYRNRAGLPMTNTGTLIVNQIRPNAQRAVWNLVHETLTHANLPASVSPLGGALPPVLTDSKMLPNGAFQFAFTNNTGATFTVLSSTNLSFAPTNWTVVGTPTNNGSGLFLFTTQPPTNDTKRFYRIRSP